MKLGKVFIVVLIAAALMSCGGLSTEQKTAANDTLKALRKVEAATQVGVNYQQYGQLAIEAKASVNQATTILPDGELKSEILGAMEAYADAGDAWGASINSKLASGSKIATDLKSKYGYEYQQSYSDSAKDEQKSLMLSTIWSAARARLDKATSLIDKSDVDWRFPGKGVISKVSGGMNVYDLGDDFSGMHIQSPKRGHMLSIGVPAAVYQKAKETSSDEKEISKAIAWEAFKKSCYAKSGSLDSDFITMTRKGSMPVFQFRSASGETAYVVVLVGNNEIFKGSMVTISKSQLDAE